MKSGNALSFADTASRVFTATTALTRYVNGAAGLGHEIKVGGEYERARARGATGYPGGRLYLDFDGAPDQVEFWNGATYRGRHSRATVYAQDAWSITGRLTVNAGMRLDLYRSAPPYPAQYATHSIAPRLGAAWDIRGDHRTVARFHFGRYYDPMVGSFYDFLDPLSDTPSIVAQVVSADEFRELYRFLPSTGFAIDPNVRHSYVEEYLLGLERSLPAGISINAQYIRRRFKDTLSFVDTATVWEPVQLRDPGPDGRLGTADDPGLVTVYNNTNPGAAYRVLTNPPQAYRHYDAVQLIGSRRFSQRWGLQASYTWSRTVGNFNNAFSSNAANNDNSINGVFVNPNRAINNEGRTAFDCTHVAKLFGTVRLPWGWLASGVYRYESGPPWNRFVVFVSGLNQGFDVVRVEPRVRTIPATNTMDLRVEKTLPLRGGRATIGAFADVFNVTNGGRARAYVENSGPRFGLPVSWSDPRILRLGARVAF